MKNVVNVVGESDFERGQRVYECAKAAFEKSYYGADFDDLADRDVYRWLDGIESLLYGETKGRRE